MAAWLIEVWGRRITLAVFLGGSAVSALLFGIVSMGSIVLPWQVIGSGMALSFFNLGAWGALYAIGPELYPTALRGTGTGAAAAFGVFFLRQFFISLPRELEEAALLDGASRWQIFYKVILPLSKPALATLALLSFLTNWNDFLWPLYVLFSPERLTIQPGLSTMQSAFTTDYATIMVGGVIASVPVLILFVIAQRFIIEGVSRSGLKG